MLIKTLLKRSIVFFPIYCNAFIALNKLQAQTSEVTPFTNFPLEDLSLFKKAPSQWRLAGSVSYDFDDPGKSTLTNGKGILVYVPSGKQENTLSSSYEHRDIAFEFSFMLAKGSSVTVYLQGRYGIKLNDSWGNAETASNVCGTIPEKSKGNRQLTAPARMNVCRAPGLWQKMQIFFQAPKFDNNGKKTHNATFSKIILNAVVIHENVELDSPSDNSPMSGEQASGPLVFSGSSAIAFKDIKYLNFKDTKNMKDVLQSVSKGNIRDRPIIVTPLQKTIVQRCFIEYDHIKRTFCAAVGEPGRINYIMDLSQGSLVNFWKGEFIDATSMWTDRGEYQIAEPIGSKIEVAPDPAFAILKNDQDSWPEKQNNAFRFNGYKLDSNGRPTFLYSMNDMQIEDKIIPENHDRFLTRSYKVVYGKNINTLWFRLAEGASIKPVGNDLFSVDDNSYYIRIVNDKRSKPIIRKSGDKQELIISGSALEKEFKYSIIW